MRVCWHVPSARSPFSDCPICARTQQQHHKGEGLLLLTLLLFIFVCALPHEFVCVCICICVVSLMGQEVTDAVLYQ